jgi:hypothetical protein
VKLCDDDVVKALNFESLNGVMVWVAVQNLNGGSVFEGVPLILRHQSRCQSWVVFGYLWLFVLGDWF